MPIHTERVGQFEATVVTQNTARLLAMRAEMERIASPSDSFMQEMLALLDAWIAEPPKAIVVDTSL